MPAFISERDLEDFDGRLRYQAVDKDSLTPEQATTWATLYRESRQRAAGVPKVGRMAFKPMAAGEHRYAVAVRDAEGLWLAAWVKRNPKGESFVLIPRAGNWDVHSSYHSDGTIHIKSFGHKSVASKRQRPAGAFAGAEHLGKHAGHFPRTVGVIESAHTDSPIESPASSPLLALAYSITLSARSSSDCGIVTPSAFAVFRLITTSNLVGCSMGRSAGFAP